MIAFKDFVPAITKEGTLLNPTQYEDMADVVALANSWIRRQAIRVVNIETLLLPYPYFESTGVARYPTASSGWYQVVRVWYEE